MFTKHLRNACLFLMLSLWLGAAAQSGNSYEGDGLVFFLGKNATGPELKDLKAHYHFEMANESHYLSQNGIELVLRGSSLYEIHLYKGSAVYGNFTGKLPKNLKFGMASGEVKAVLGKPSLSYSSGYCEYEYPTHLLSFWFDGGKLSQVILSVKSVSF
ncbi:MAG: hypothetical protein V4615_04620 [Bacteroidota bacterium]